MKEKKREEKKHMDFFVYAPYIIIASTLALFLIAASDAIDI